MVRFEHVNIFVKDLTRALTFYQAAMPHWSVLRKGAGDWYGSPRRWIHFGDDYSYLAISDNGSGENRVLTSNTVGLAHIAFEISNMDALVYRLHHAGFEPCNLGADEPFRRNIYFIDPDGFEVEFVEYLSDLPQERNLT